MDIEINGDFQIPLSPPLQTIKNKKSPRKREINKNKNIAKK